MHPPAGLRGVLAAQAGVVSRAQALDHGLGPHDIRRLVRRREWSAVHPGVYVDHTGPLTWEQRAWAAVLHAWPAALCEVSALGRDDGVVHVAISADRRVGERPGVRVHRMRHFDARVQWNLGPPRLRHDEAVLDVAAGARDDLEAVGVIADAVGRRRTTAARLRGTLEDRDWSPRRGFLLDVLADVDGGACSVLEHAYLVRVVRPHRLPAARHQQRERVGDRVVYRDAAYDDVLVELDGRLFHDSVEQRDRDLDRDLVAALTSRTTVRLGYGQVLRRPCVTAGRVALLLRSHGWGGRPSACGPGCDVERVWSVGVSR